MTSHQLWITHVIHSIEIQQFQFHFRVSECFFPSTLNDYLHFMLKRKKLRNWNWAYLRVRNLDCLIDSFQLLKIFKIMSQQFRKVFSIRVAFSEIGEQWIAQLCFYQLIQLKIVSQVHQKESNLYLLYTRNMNARNVITKQLKKNRWDNTSL